MIENIPNKSSKTSDKLDWLINQIQLQDIRNDNQDKRLDSLGAPQQEEEKPKSRVRTTVLYVILFALVIGIFYLVFLFVMQQMGHNIVLPQFMR